MENFFYETRKKLHQMPEIALEEYQTSKFIRNFLKKLKPEKIITVVKIKTLTIWTTQPFLLAYGLLKKMRTMLLR